MKKVLDNIETAFKDGLAKARKASESDLTCAFCGEDDFDKAGLKTHFLYYCDEYDKVVPFKRSIFP